MNSDPVVVRRSLFVLGLIVTLIAPMYIHTYMLTAVITTLPRFEFAILSATAGLVAYRTSGRGSLQLLAGLATAGMAFLVMHFVLDSMLSHLAEHFSYLEKPDRVVPWETYMPQASQFLYEGLLLGACASLTWLLSTPKAHRPHAKVSASLR